MSNFKGAFNEKSPVVAVTPGFEGGNLQQFAAERHKRKGYTDSVFAGCSAKLSVVFPWDMRLDLKTIMGGNPSFTKTCTHRLTKYDVTHREKVRIEFCQSFRSKNRCAARANYSVPLFGNPLAFDQRERKPPVFCEAAAPGW